MKKVVIAITSGGKKLADKISSLLEECVTDTRKIPVAEKITSHWDAEVDAIICVMAAGIVVRSLAPLVKNKKNDPCVLVLDEKGEYVISLLSGHLGGGNSLAVKLASKLGASPVVTTSSDVTGHTALDLWAKKNDLYVTDARKLTEMSARLVNCGHLKVFTTCHIENLPDDFMPVPDPMAADIIISDRVRRETWALIIIPNTLTVGLGCNRGTCKEDIAKAVGELFAGQGLERRAIAKFASIDLKSDEEGMLAFAESYQIPIEFYTKDELNRVDGVSSSDIVYRATGAKGVAEPAALLASLDLYGSGKLIVRKKKWKDVTVAVAAGPLRIQG